MPDSENSKNNFTACAKFAGRGWRASWVTEAWFLDLLGGINLIPGPNSTEPAIPLGRKRAGWRGLLVAGICFIFPAVCVTGMFAWLHARYGVLPEAQD